jgi:anti-sigma factor RsiW
MISHQDTTVMMSLALDEMLSPEESAELNEHLDSCPSCRATWACWQSVGSLLSAQPLAGPSPNFSERVMVAVDQSVDRQSRAKKAALLGGSLSIWVALIVALGIAAALWVLSDPLIIALSAERATRILSTCALLFKGLRLGLAGVARTDVLSLVVNSAAVGMGLAVLAALFLQQMRRDAAVSGTGS